MRGVGLALALLAGPAGAHPHVFVDVALDIVVGANGPEAVRVTWTYDDFFSLLLTEDLGLDPDLDGTLTAEEMAALSAYVLDWPEGFEGDLHLEAGGHMLMPGPRRDPGVDFVDGRMIETHVRPLPPGPGGPLTLRVYDPFYYTAYSVTGVTFSGAGGCTAQVAAADLIAATERVDELLYAVPQDQAEVEFPMVGEEFADTVTITCAG